MPSAAGPGRQNGSRLLPGLSAATATARGQPLGLLAARPAPLVAHQPRTRRPAETCNLAVAGGQVPGRRPSQLPPRAQIRAAKPPAKVSPDRPTRERRGLRAAAPITCQSSPRRRNIWATRIQS